MDSNRSNASDSQVRDTDIEPNSSTGKRVARSTKITISPSVFPRNLAMLPSNVEYVVKVFTCVRQQLGRPKEDKMEQVNTNAMIWGLFITASIKAAVHLGKVYEENLHVMKNTEFSKFRPLFSITQKLMFDQEDEMFGISTIDCDQTPWMRSTLIHEHVIKFSTARVHVFSDSVLCLGGKIAEYQPSVQTWTNGIEWFTPSVPYRVPDKIDGDSVVFEWKFFPGHTTLTLCQEV